MLKAGNTLLPSGVEDIEKLKSVRNGELIEATLTQGRDVVKHRHFFAMMSFTLKNWPESRGKCPFKNVESFLDALKDAVGFFDIYTRMDGTQMKKLRSIAWTKTDQTEFMERIYTPCVEVMAGILGCLPEELIQGTIAH